MTDDQEAKAEGLTIACPNGHVEWMHPQTEFGPTDRFWCGECGHDFGNYGDVHRRLFVGGAMLDEALARKP